MFDLLSSGMKTPSLEPAKAQNRHAGRENERKATSGRSD
jgi:hypothetical protein